MEGEVGQHEGKSSSSSTAYGLNTRLQHTCGEAGANTCLCESIEGENALGRKVRIGRFGEKEEDGHGEAEKGKMTENRATGRQGKMSGWSPES